MTAPFRATWGTLCERCEELPEDAMLITSLSSKRFSITDVRQSRIIIEDTDTGDTQPLAREQFATLAHALEVRENSEGNTSGAVRPCRSLAV